jgi:hypothetical protein
MVFARYSASIRHGEFPKRLMRHENIEWRK